MVLREREREREREKLLAIPEKLERSHCLSDSLEGWRLIDHKLRTSYIIDNCVTQRGEIPRVFNKLT